MNYTLPENLRVELKKPLGVFIENLSDLKKTGMIICVGDKSTEKTLKSKLTPKICIYDGQVARKKIRIPEIVKNFSAREIHVKNPPGKITEETFNAIKKAIRDDENTKIIVDGEEDLTALAAVSSAPVGSVVLYGQPNEGLIMVKVDDNIKDKVGRILKEMENEG